MTSNNMLRQERIIRQIRDSLIGDDGEIMRLEELSDARQPEKLIDTIRTEDPYGEQIRALWLISDVLSWVLCERMQLDDPWLVGLLLDDPDTESSRSNPSNN